MNIKIKLTKKQILKLSLFVAVIGAAFLFDSYLDKNPVHLDKIVTGSTKQHNKSTNKVNLISQLNIPGVKVELQKPAFRNLQPKLHDRLIQKYHLTRNYQVLKAETEPKTSPIISAYHYLAFKNYFFTNPDDDPPVS